MKLTFSCFCWAHLSETLRGSIFGSHLGTILRARVVIGAIVGARGAAECLKAGGSFERLFQASEIRTRGGPSLSVNGCPTVPRPVSSPSTEEERKREDVALESIH